MDFRMNKIVLSLIFLLTLTLGAFAQIPDKSQLLKIAEEKYGITPDNANITESELQSELLKSGVDLTDEAAVEKKLVEIIRARQKAKPVSDKKTQIKDTQPSSTPSSPQVPKESKVEILEKAFERNIEVPTGEVLNNPDADDAKSPVVTPPEAKNKVFGQNFPSSISLQVDPKNVNPKNSYIIGTGDAFGINIHGPRYASFLLVVNEEGYTSIPEIPGSRMYLRGLTYGKAKKVIRGTISKIFNLNLAYLEITLNYARTVTVQITGEVTIQGTHVLTGANTAFSALAATKGLKDIASVRNIQLRRGGEPNRTLDIYKYLSDPTYGEDYYLRDNDFIVVPTIGKVVEIKGEIRRPFRYELVDGEDLRHLIDYAAGLTAKAYTKNIKIKRIINNEFELLDVDLDAVLNGSVNFPLMNGDVIEIRAINPLNKDIVTTAGEFLYPDQYAFEEGRRVDYYLNKSILTEEARTDTAFVIRKFSDGSSSYIKISIDNILKDPNAPSNIILQPLDVIQVAKEITFRFYDQVSLSGEINNGTVKNAYDSSLTVRDLIFLGGGLKPNYADKAVLKRTSVKDGTVNYIDFSINEIMDNNSNFNEQFKLAPKDAIIIYNYEATIEKYEISINGEVRRPSRLTYSEDLTLKDILYLGGGLKPTASNKIIIERRDINTLQKEYLPVDIDALLLPGSTLNETIQLKPGDNIKVLTPIQEGEYSISVEGQVYQPGSIAWGSGLKLGDAIRLSGGLKPEAANSRLEISRVFYNNNSQASEVKVAYFDIDQNSNLVSGQDFKLERYDKVVVRIAPEFSLQQYVTISGEVRFPGSYPLLGKNERVSSIVNRAGGISLEAFPEGARLVRKEDDTGFVLLDLEDILNKENKSNFNYILRPGDEIFIPKATDLIGLSGAIDHPGVITDGSINVPYHKGRKAGYYIRRYGQGVDRNKEGRMRFVKVQYANGDIKKTVNLGFTTITPRVKQGSSIMVGTIPPKPASKERQKGEPVDWGEVFDKTITQVTAVLTLYLLLQSAFQ